MLKTQWTAIYNLQDVREREIEWLTTLPNDTHTHRVTAQVCLIACLQCLLTGLSMCKDIVLVT